ncbi:MAG: nucleotide sugar dehydrogenase [Methanospirillum sp.]|nr:nucleotide sugar dehydrogenase [Methanospirillum sp.]
MVHLNVTDLSVCVVGLGYVGYPLAEAFSSHLHTIGYDIDSSKLDTIRRTAGNRIDVADDPARIREADVVIIAVPTPVTRAKDPDLGPVASAAATIGRNLKPGATVVLESTVYPGVTEELMAPVLERESGLTCGKDFFIGYSPERINPGDDEHILARIVKIVAGMDEKTTDLLTGLYGLVTTVHRAPTIRTAEAAKVIENIQRDLNIALMNELSLIFSRMGLNTHAVLEAAGTKWNFHHYRPGLVGGHCIPVDPYYLVYKAEELGYHPQVILAGRAINDHMPKHVASLAIKGMNDAGKVIRGSTVVILGLTYKENVPDTRESPSHEMIAELREFHAEVCGFDPLLTPEEIARFNVRPLAELGDSIADCLIINVPHDQFLTLSIDDVRRISKGTPVVVDVKGVHARWKELDPSIHYRTL